MDFKIGEIIMVTEDHDGDDPVAQEYPNRHATIKGFFPPYVEVEFLNGDIHRVLEKHIRRRSN